jgi:hypothetical protein
MKKVIPRDGKMSSQTACILLYRTPICRCEAGTSLSNELKVKTVSYSTAQDTPGIIQNTIFINYIIPVGTLGDTEYFR